MELKKQPSAMPTRKLMAVIVATFVIKGAVGVADVFWPGASQVLPAQDWIELVAPILAGWFVRDRA